MAFNIIMICTNSDDTEYLDVKDESSIGRYDPLPSPLLPVRHVRGEGEGGTLAQGQLGDPLLPAQYQLSWG